MRPAIPAAAVALAMSVTLAAGSTEAQKTAAAPQAVTPAQFSAYEMVYEPITSCRAFDTHASQPLMAPRAFTISGSSNLKAQGGPKLACGIPAAAVAVTISLSTSDATDPGTIAGYPKGMPVTNAVVAYGPTGPDVAGATLGLSDKQLSLAPSVGSVQVAGDVTGYFAPQIEGYLNSDGSMYSHTPRILSSSHDGTGEYSVVLDRMASTCAAQVTPGVSGYVATGVTNNNVLSISTYQLGGSGPVAADTHVNFSVHC